MDKHQKQLILNECHSNIFEIDTLDNMVQNGHVSIEEFQQYNLEISKVNELKKRKAERDNLPEEVDRFDNNPLLHNDFNFSNDFVFDANPIDKSSSKENSTYTEKSHNGHIKPVSPKDAAIKDIVQKKTTISEISTLLSQKVLDYGDLESAGINRRLLNSIKYRTSEHRVTIFKKIKDLPPMQEGRTDLYFVGVSKAGKSTMLGGLLYKMHREGNLMPDTYNTDGTEYQTGIISDIDHGVLPARTALGSYNYVAVSIKDKDNHNHPFNIVEVPGENYERISSGGVKSTGEDDFIVPFVNYIRNRNKKILIFVIDVFAHENRHEAVMHTAKNQSLAYTNILNMFRDNGILENTDAIYLALNKFDIIRDSHRQGNESEVETASRYLQEEFKALITNCKEARDRTKSGLKIKILPYSIGDVVYSEILERFEPTYSEILADNLMGDSFVIKGGKFWKKIF